MPGIWLTEKNYDMEKYDIHSQKINEKEQELENALRPLSFKSFSGQEKIVENLRIFVQAARMRAEALDHVLLHGRSEERRVGKEGRSRWSPYH